MLDPLPRPQSTVSFRFTLPRKEKFDSAHNLTFLHLFPPSLTAPPQFHSSRGSTLKRDVSWRNVDPISQITPITGIINDDGNMPVQDLNILSLNSTRIFNIRYA